ncbi:type II and III secretion system protein family protein [Phenylobacterium sp.]|uniref:type II and III secretion system protein family protein n=1 Tax=Phenylobacterium sp. TaxID=1871053 RepID=UPI002F3E76C5
MPRNLATAFCATLTLLTTGAVASPALADALPSEAAPSRVISVPRDKSLSFRLDQPATKIVVAQPDIAEIVATTDRSFYVRGLELGSTNLLVYGPGGRLMEVIDVRVGVDAKTLEGDLAQALPAEHIKVQTLGDGILLTGNVTNPGVALRAKAIAEMAAPDGVTSMLRVNGAQVVLEVRILEANRSMSNDFGLAAQVSNSSFSFGYGTGLLGTTAPTASLSLTGGSGKTTIDVQLAAAEARGLVRTLARPNLVAMSGEKASFIAGGEFPYPVPAGNNQFTIDFRSYGVKLNFIPTVEDDGKIRLAVEPEVSALDPAHSLTSNGVTVPALIVRRTNTVVELKNGESLAIGGLFQRNYANALRQIPGIGEIPILSALFRSTHWERGETELVIVVTPRIVNQADINAAATATVGGPEPRVLDLMLKGESADTPMLRDPGDFPAPRFPTPQLRGEIAPVVPAKGK